MNKKDVAGITIAKSFNKKWWDSNRSSKIKGTGTGALLDTWKKACPDSVDDMTVQAIDAAEKSCEALRQNFRAAQAKCGKGEQDDLEGIKKMLGLLDGYETRLAGRRKTITNAAMALTGGLDDICTEIAKQKSEIEKLVPDIKNLRSRLTHYTEEASGELMKSDKEILLKDLAEEQRRLSDLEDRANEATNSVKMAESQLRNEIKVARVDARFRPIVQKYDAARADLDKKFFEVVNQIHDTGIDVNDLKKEIAGAGTADHAIEELERQVTMLESGPGLDRYAGVMDIIKKWAGEVVKAGQKPETVSKDGWAKLIDVETEFEDEFGALTDTDNALARGMKMILKTGQRFKGVTLVERQVEAAKQVAAKRAKERSDLMKVAPQFRSQLKSLISHMP